MVISTERVNELSWILSESDSAEELAAICKYLETAVEIDSLVICNANTIATRVFVQMYTSGHGTFENLDSLRSHLYYGGKKPMEGLPPTVDA